MMRSGIFGSRLGKGGLHALSPSIPYSVHSHTDAWRSHTLNPFIFLCVKRLFYGCFVEGETLLLHFKNNQMIPPNELFVICNISAL